MISTADQSAGQPVSAPTVDFDCHAELLSRAQAAGAAARARALQQFRQQNAASDWSVLWPDGRLQKFAGREEAEEARGILLSRPVSERWRG
ncbi:MAG: hypothetical protein JWM64_232 [Frankiales bacterium]|nr:hypothetical protein [Frankiales bacterium]